MNETLSALSERTAAEFVRHVTYLDIARLDALSNDPDAQAVYACYVDRSVKIGLRQGSSWRPTSPTPNGVVDAHNRLVAFGWLEQRSGAFSIVRDEVSEHGTALSRRLPPGKPPVSVPLNSRPLERARNKTR